LVCFGLDGAASLYSHDDDGAVGPAQEAAVAPRKKATVTATQERN
jgi:hypothetical protein